MSDLTDHTTMARLARIHRCTCGAWVHAKTAPTTCQHMQPRKENAA